MESLFDLKQVEQIKNLLKKRGETIAVAESVTSGLLQTALSQAEGATQIFQGGITAYNLGQKARHLKINPIEAEACNCVSENVAVAMAHEVCRLFSSDFGVSITGYASAVPELNVHDLYAFLAVSYRQKVIYSKKIKGNNAHSALENQVLYTNKILAEVLKFLKTK